jgi:hypothetical protein
MGGGEPRSAPQLVILVDPYFVYGVRIDVASSVVLFTAVSDEKDKNSSERLSLLIITL